MSVTFYVDGDIDEFPYGNSVCPDCGGVYGAPCDPNCGSCMGFGGDQERIGEWFDERYLRELNVANANAAFIVREVLGMYLLDDEISGRMHPDAVLFHVSMYTDPSDGERPSEVDGNTIIFGRTREQVQRYLDKLTRIALLAKGAGRDVVWA